MKKLMSSMLAIAAMASMISCSTEDILDQETPGTDNNGLVPIKMTAAIGDLTTKALVPQNEDGTLKDNVEDVHFLRFDAKTADAAVPDWSTWDKLVDAKILKEGGVIELAETQYYQNNGFDTYLLGYHPAATTTNNTLTWTLDGKKDIIISNVQSGNKKTTEANKPNFTFNHQLTLLRFKIMLPASSSATGEKLSSIKVKDQNSTAIYNPSTKSFTYSTPIEMTTEGAAVDTDITTTSIDGGYLLVEPNTAADGKSFSIVVATKVGADSKEYTGDITIEATKEKAYNVQLTIDQKQVSGTASVAPWQTGTDPGNETIY